MIDVPRPAGFGRPLPGAVDLADDGGADPALAAVLAGAGSSRGGTGDGAPSDGAASDGAADLDAYGLSVLGAARVFVGIEPRALETAADGADRVAEMALLIIQAPSGASAVPAFSGIAALSAWRPAARPVPVTGRELAAEALRLGHEALVLDPGRSDRGGGWVVDGADLARLADAAGPIAAAGLAGAAGAAGPAGPGLAGPPDGHAGSGWGPAGPGGPVRTAAGLDRITPPERPWAPEAVAALRAGLAEMAGSGRPPAVWPARAVVSADAVGAPVPAPVPAAQPAADLGREGSDGVDVLVIVALERDVGPDSAARDREVTDALRAALEARWPGGAPAVPPFVLVPAGAARAVRAMLGLPARPDRGRRRSSRWLPRSR